MTLYGKPLYSIRRILLLVCICCCSPAIGQDAKAGADTGRINDLQAALEADDKLSDPSQPKLAPILIPEQYLDSSGKEALKTSMRSYYEYRTKGFEHRQRVFEWQLLSSRVIFVVVIFLVVVGVYFSWLQFRADMRREDEGGEKQTLSTVKASAQGIEVSSPVLGVIILVISLLFFYLYLVHVYPIEEIL